MNFIKEFFILNLNDYENIPFYFPVGLLITLLTVAMCVAVFVINYRNGYTCAMIKQLLRHGATDENGAKTLKELRLDNIYGLKGALSRSGRLTYIVKRVGDVKPSYEEFMANRKKRGYKEEGIDFSEARFYIAEEQLDRAKGILEKSGASIWKPIILSVIFIAAWVILALFLPDLLEYINSSLM